MAKRKTKFMCKSCGYESAKWMVGVRVAGNGIRWKRKLK